MVRDLTGMLGGDIREPGDDGNPSWHMIRLRERARIAAILESPAARSNLDEALAVALHSSLSGPDAIRFLRGVGRWRDIAFMASLPRPANGNVVAPVASGDHNGGSDER
jgi:hypothetical protein